MLQIRMLVVCVLLLSTGCGVASQEKPLDRSQLTLTFAEDFRQPPSFYDALLAPNGRWKTNYAGGVQDPTSDIAWQTRTLTPNGELQYYGDPFAGDTAAFDWGRGHLDLVAQPNPIADVRRTGGLPYVSGLITTEKSFHQRYGYFEARIRMPIGSGLWPAFWLLPVPRLRPDTTTPAPPQEVDVFENIGKDHEIYATVHHSDNGQRVKDGERIAMVASVTEPHVYGVLVTSAYIVWYIDSREVRRARNLDFHDESYILLNLAVSGEWPAPPDDNTKFPAVMTVYWVRAYSVKTPVLK